MKILDISRIMLVMFLWAVCFPLIVAGFAYAPHLTFAALRAFIAGAALIAIGAWLGRPLPKGRRVWFTIGAIGIGATSLAYLGMFHAAEFVAPGIATVIANTQPLLAAVLASLFLREHLDMRGKLGLALGFAGILAIATPQLSGGQAENYAIGVAYILLAALGISVSNVLIKRIAGQVDAVMATGFQLLIGGIPLAIAAFTLEDPASVIWSPRFLAVLLALSLFGSALVYWLWLSVLAKIPLTRANSFSFFVPVFGLALAAAFYGEPLGWTDTFGIGLTLVGVALVNRKTPPRTQELPN